MYLLIFALLCTKPYIDIKKTDKPPSSQHCVNCRHTISWSLNLYKVIWLHQPRSGLRHKGQYTLKQGQKPGEKNKYGNGMYSWLTDLWKQQHTSQRRWGKKPTSWKRNVITLQLKRPHISKDPYSNQGNGTLKKVRVKGKTGEANGRWEEWGSGEEWAHHEESRVHHSPCCWDDLTSSSVERLLSYDRVQDLELDISDGWRQQNTRLWLNNTDEERHILTVYSFYKVRRKFQHQMQSKQNKDFLHRSSVFQWCGDQRENLRSSHRGPSLVPHWKPCTMLSLTEPSSALSTCRWNTSWWRIG